MENQDKNFTENKIGGIDCERFIQSIDGYAPYTMKAEEARQVRDSGVEIKLLSDTVKADIAKAKLIQEAKQARNIALNTLVYDLKDGRVIQTRPQDGVNLAGQIAKGIGRRWTMADNSVAVVTIDELKAAYAHGINAVDAVWNTYHDTIESIAN